ncbi:hypothetical protein C2845_PM16G14950 [Panicum miliaceum]|uniref:Disease resistance protein winged helix domain-containing protein n=1 Tax=Panicum miliaceum TaxID=4540 RepID=A0A3L6PWP8_PANMI|nr:hypothetical protein C2845_PM16G14950 [Panicum miliaceum]
MVDPLTLSGIAWGISTAGWIISPIITKLVNKALSHIKPGKSKDELHELLTHTLPRLALTLEAAEGSAHKDLFEKLVRDLKSAFYDLEDMLDKVEYVLHEKQLIAQKKSKRIMFASHDDAGSSDQKKIKKIKELVGEAQKTIELANLPCHKGNGKNRSTVTQKRTTSDPVEKVIGRDELHSQIIEMLHDMDVGDVDQQLPLLLSPFKVGSLGSKILVTSRNADALSDLGISKKTIIPIPDLDDKVFFELLMYYALGDSRVDDMYQNDFDVIGTEIAQKLKRSPLAARTKRCFAYCSIFPRRHNLHRDELINMWVAEGFIKTTDAEEEMEAVGRDYVDELVSISFLQIVGNRYPTCYLVHDLLHDLAEKVAGRDCFRIENGWTGEVHQDVRHLFVETVNEHAIIDKIVKLEMLRTLIIRIGKNNIISDETIEKTFTKLTNLRVLDILSDMGPRYRMQLGALPDNIEHLKSLTVLRIQYCLNIRSLPVLPQSLKRIEFWGCDEAFMRSCETPGDPNWRKIKHIPSVCFEVPIVAAVVSEDDPTIVVALQVPGIIHSRNLIPWKNYAALLPVEAILIPWKNYRYSSTNFVNSTVQDGYIIATSVKECLDNSIRECYY